MIALARKYRPKRFADLLVQEHVAAALRGAVAKGRVGHGYLLAGPRGTGKTTAARILAMALNCERPDPAQPGEPCGECSSCERVWSGSANLDVVEIDAASNRGVDDARELRERAMYAASQQGRYKVYIIDEAHMLTREAWNALLKILEEPPPAVIFVFATTEPQKIASTAAPVLSRLQRFDFRRIGPSAIRARLHSVLKAEGLEAEEDALTLIARYADGGMRDALSVLDQCLSFGEGPINAAAVRQVLGLIDDEQYAEALRAIADRDTAAIFPLVDALVNAGADLAEFMTGMADLLRAVLMTDSGVEPDGLTDALRQAIEQSRGKLRASDLVRMLGLLADAETAIRRSASARLIVETLLLRWTLMDRVVELEELIRSEGRSESRKVAKLESGGTGKPESPRTGKAEAQPASPASLSPVRLSELTIESLRSAWPDLVLAARARSNLLGQALEATTPLLVQGGQVQLIAGPEQAVLVDGLQRQLHVLDELIGSHFATRVKVRVSLGTTASGSEPPKRLTDEVLRSERLDRLRRLDPALDTVANELDLEIVDESPRSP